MSDDLFKRLTGEDFQESFTRHMMKRWNDSWGQQPREERKRRMHFVLRMAEELANIRKVTNFSTGWCEMVIEDVILGDLESLRFMGVEGLSAKGFEENVGGPTGARYADIFAKFREICEEAYLSAQAKERV